MIAVVDYAKGNLRSVQKGLEVAGARDVRIVVAPDDIAAADAVVLPGVGAFADAAQSMRESGQMDAVRAAIDAGRPFMGICLGLHLLFEAGEEGAADAASLPQGLGVIPGVVGPLPRTDAEGVSYKVPHVGWNSIDFAVPANDEKADAAGLADTSSSPLFCPSRTEVRVGSKAELSEAPPKPSLTEVDLHDVSPLLRGIDEGEFFYFTHSYVAPENPYTQATTVHSTAFPCFVDVGGTCFGIQFHPEKSSEAGLRVLRNFVRVVEEV